MENDLVEYPIVANIMSITMDRNGNKTPHIKTFHMFSQLPKHIENILFNYNDFKLLDKIPQKDTKVLDKFFKDNWKPPKLQLTGSDEGLRYSHDDKLTGSDEGLRYSHDDKLTGSHEGLRYSHDDKLTGSHEGLRYSHDDKLTGSDDDKTDIISLSDLETIQPKKSLFTRRLEEVTFKPFSNVTVYPHDNIWDLKNKISVFLNIPAWRLHISLQGANTFIPPYEILINRTINYPIDYQQLLQTSDELFGISLDLKLFQNKNNVLIKAFDTFRLLEDIFVMLESSPRILILDFNDFIPNIEELTVLTTSTYNFERFYYGFVRKFWPWINEQILTEFIKSGEMVFRSYPDVFYQPDYYRELFKTQDKYMRMLYEVEEKKYKSLFKSSIIKTNIFLECKNNLDLKLLFNAIKLGMYNITSMKLFEEEYVYYKIYKNVQKRKSFSVALKEGLILRMSIEGYKSMIINLTKKGLTIMTFWESYDNITFKKLINIAEKYVNPLIDYINNNFVIVDKSEGVIGYKMKLIPPVDQRFLTYENIMIDIMFEKFLTKEQFAQFSKDWKTFSKSDIIDVKKIETNNIITVFKKGLNFFRDNALRNSIIGLKSYYNYLSDNNIKIKWEQNYYGKMVYITHRYTDVNFRITGINDDELYIFYRFLYVFFDLYLKNIENVAMSKTLDTKKENHSVKKLSELDPVLYKFSKDQKTKVYSVLCQKSKQPVYVMGHEKDKFKNIVNYWNFTKNEPAMYSCPNKKYPYFGFTGNKHPQGFCLPCCKKKDPKVLETQEEFYKHCMDKHTYPKDKTQSISKKIYVFNYGKEVSKNKLIYPPPNFSKAFPDLYIYGVDTINKNVNIINCFKLFYPKVSTSKYAQMVINEAYDQGFCDILTNMGKYATIFKDGKDLSTTLLNSILNVTPSDLVYNEEDYVDILVEIIEFVYRIHIVVLTHNDMLKYKMLSKRDNKNNSGIFESNDVFVLFLNEDGFYHPIIHVDNLLKTQFVIHKLNEKEQNTIRTIISSEKKLHGDIEKKYIGRNGNCYGLLINDNNRYVYIGVDYINVTLDKNCIYEPFNIWTFEQKIDYKDTIRVLNKSRRVISNIITTDNEKFIAFKTIDNFIHYFTPVDISDFHKVDLSVEINDRFYVIEHLPENLQTINEKLTFGLIKNSHVPFTEEEILDINENILEINLYKLFLINFTSGFIWKLRNTEKRKGLENVLSQVERLDEINDYIYKLTNDEYDSEKIIDIISNYYPDKELIMNEINKGIYKFDINYYLIDMHEMNTNELRTLLVNELSKIMNIGENFAVNRKKIINKVTSCRIDDTLHCEDGKFTISKRLFDKYIDLLVDDIKNPIRYKILPFMRTKLMDPLVIESEPYEKIIITLR